jgi:hypothetical protein
LPLGAEGKPGCLGFTADVVEYSRTPRKVRQIKGRGDLHVAEHRVEHHHGFTVHLQRETGLVGRGRNDAGRQGCAALRVLEDRTQRSLVAGTGAKG